MSFRLLLAPLLILGLAVGGEARAQVMPDTVAIEPDAVTVGQIVSFVNALIAVERVRKDYSARIDAAETDAEKQALAEEADEIAIDAVDKVAGITPGEYLGILDAAAESEELTERIKTRFAELRSKQGATQ